MLSILAHACVVVLFCCLFVVVIVDTYAKSIELVQTEEDYVNTLHEMDGLIQQKTSKKSAPVKQHITYESYPRKLRSLKEKVKIFEELFLEYQEGPIETDGRVHEMQRKQKLRIDTARGGQIDPGMAQTIRDLQTIREEFDNPELNGEAEDDFLDFDEMKEESWQFTKRAVEQKNLRRQMIKDMVHTYTYNIQNNIMCFLFLIVRCNILIKI